MMSLAEGDSISWLYTVNEIGRVVRLRRGPEYLGARNGFKQMQIVLKDLVACDTTSSGHKIQLQFAQDSVERR